MIDIKELRVENLILNDNYICEVLHIYGGSYYSCKLKTKQGSEITAQYDLIRPIPLTEEWLLRFGFKKYIHKPIEGEEEKCEEYCIDKLSIVDWGYGFIMSNAFAHGLRIELKSVHQLQNLYFSLTGTELALKS